MAGLNKVILIGNLGKDPEIMTFENGVKRAAFSLATTESYRDKDGNWVDQTDWHNIVLWRWLAERNLIKGDSIYVEGKLKTRSWDDKDGIKHYTTEVVGDRVIKLSGKREQSTGHVEPPPPADLSNYPEAIHESTHNEGGPTDDLPF